MVLLLWRVWDGGHKQQTLAKGVVEGPGSMEASVVEGVLYAVCSRCTAVLTNVCIWVIS